MSITFDIDGEDYDYNGGAEYADATGSGTLKSGIYTTSFTLEGVHLSTTAYPPSGALTYSAGSHDAVVTFNGTQFATVTVGEDTYQVNLETGELITPP